jgi:tRNA-dihydrouridine synthase B
MSANASPTQIDIDHHLATPLKIGPVNINSRIMLAPMAGVTDVAFRSLVRQWAKDSLICTEMISSNGLVYSKRYDAPILDKVQSDHPIAYQLAGHRIEVLTEAARNIVKDKNPDTLDINMGCPVKKITGNFEGCALMKEPELAYKLISALVKDQEREGTNKPVTVKFRLGWDSNSMNYKEFGKMCEDAGAAMVTLHARTRAQGYQPGCKWEAFGELKEILSIPVVANGDIRNGEEALHVLKTYGVDGIMMGRGILGQPWLIGELDRALKAGTSVREVTAIERLETAKEHAILLVDSKGERTAIREMRRHLTDYVKAFPGASEYRSRLTAVETYAQVDSLLDEIRDTILKLDETASSEEDSQLLKMA